MGVNPGLVVVAAVSTTTTSSTMISLVQGYIKSASVIITTEASSSSLLSEPACASSADSKNDLSVSSHSTKAYPFATNKRDAGTFFGRINHDARRTKTKMVNKNEINSRNNPREVEFKRGLHFVDTPVFFEV
ncbi:hypothetical protein BDA99DRAFT_537021 [Phascolomyces articulosus]|uniref:Uncharacterized protein n=1 Tax=Phascolomyces articulosus TaxID=60185 RepID=A0AAD5KB80_9FUNG|nr:hypothetical protein BDA99DRAFT_537021 [Phascolomyces articulosus]